MDTKSQPSSQLPGTASAEDERMMPFATTSLRRPRRAGFYDRFTRWFASFRRSLSGSKASIPDWTSDNRLDLYETATALQRRVETAEAALVAKTRSIALTSHELRTPLNGVLGMTGLLERTALSLEQANYVQAIRTSANALLSLVDDLLDVGKIAAGHWQLKPQPVAIEALIEGVIELLAPRAQAKGLELAAHIGLHVPDIVRVDQDQVARILMNLIGNAIKFTERGGVAIEVTAEAGTETNVTLMMRVRDSGIGIAPEDQTRIFGEYEQAVDRAFPGGTGLGLAISRAMARMMGGDITLESAPEKGSTFCLRIDVPIEHPTTVHVHPLVGRHVLLLSNLIIEPPLLMRRLFDLGASVELARSSQAAYDILAAGRSVDAILFDHGTYLDTAEFCRDHAGCLPPIAVMIAPADRDVLPYLKESGIEAHLVKPIRTESLTKVISAMLSGDAIANPAPAKVAADPIEQPTPLRLLLADDNEINILIGKSIVQSLGHAIETVNDGASAVTRLEEALRLGRPYDVILMDLHMPVLDGFAAIGAIRAATIDADRRPFIIALTADTTDESAARAIDCGADITLTKPFQQSTLAEILKRHRWRDLDETSMRAWTDQAS